MTKQKGVLKRLSGCAVVNRICNGISDGPAKSAASCIVHVHVAKGCLSDSFLHSPQTSHMDRSNLFSRGATPPNPQQHQNFQQNSNNNAPNTIDALFQSISVPSPDRHIIDSHSVDNNTFEAAQDDQPTATDRQSALLSLIGRQPQPQLQQPPQSKKSSARKY